MIRSEDAYPALGAGHFQKLAVAYSGCCVRHSQNGWDAILSGGDGCVAQNSSCLDDDGAGDGVLVAAAVARRRKWKKPTHSIPRIFPLK